MNNQDYHVCNQDYIINGNYVNRGGHHQEQNNVMNFIPKTMNITIPKMMNSTPRWMLVYKQ